MFVPEPVSTPDTTPVDDTVAEVLLLLHVPPRVASDSDVPEPWQRLPIPEIGSGKGLTSTAKVAGLQASVV